MMARRRMRGLWWKIGTPIVAIVLGVWLMREIGGASHAEAVVRVRIPKGSTVRAAADSLERAGVIGKWVAGLFGAAWTVITFMTVPILVSRDIGPLDAVKESAMMLKKTWGENLIGQGGVGVVFGLLQFLVVALTVVALIAVAGTKSMALIVTVGALGVITMMALALVQSALSGIYSAALYRHAMGEDTVGMDSQLLASAFAAKR